MNTEKDCQSQLGEPTQVADTAVVAYRKRTFFGRHPVAKFLVFGVSPIPVMFLTFCLTIACMACLCFLGEEYCGFQTKSFLKSFDNPAPLEWIMSIATLVLPSTLLTIFYCRWARRSKLKKRWMLIACIMMAIIPMLTVHMFTFSDIPLKSTYDIGMSLPPTTVQQYVQMLVPIAVGLWYLRRTRQQPTDKEEPLRAAA